MRKAESLALTKIVDSMYPVMYKYNDKESSALPFVDFFCSPTYCIERCCSVPDLEPDPEP